MEHSKKERQYICLLLEKLYWRVYPDGTPNRMETSMEWLAAIRRVDGLMLSVRGDGKFTVGMENPVHCFDDELRTRLQTEHGFTKEQAEKAIPMEAGYE